MSKIFSSFAVNAENPKWEQLIKREGQLYSRSDDVRNEFSRDYSRILHSLAYRRLKHKTQVFYNIGNDHVCTRMEHVAHVESVSHTIADTLGLNIDLTKAIAMGHDLGHAPFGHKGEYILRELSEKYLNKSFWHEQNGLRFVDRIELLEDKHAHLKNLMLTYAVRDGIISHCGEIDKNGLIPRDELLGLNSIKNAGEFEPATWEGCVVKLSDKIAYVGRDIEDAKRLGFLSDSDKKKLEEYAKAFDGDAINTTVIMHNLIIDVCNNSSPEAGICLSEDYAKRLKEIKDFNYHTIYDNKRLKYFEEYARLVINSLFKQLYSAYKAENTFSELLKMEQYYPSFIKDFSEWLAKYVDKSIVPEYLNKDITICDNEKIYHSLEKEEYYIQAVIDYISGMTDGYAIRAYNELITF